MSWTNMLCHCPVKILTVDLLIGARIRLDEGAVYPI